MKADAHFNSPAPSEAIAAKQPTIPQLPAGYRLRDFSLADYNEVLALWRSCEGIGLNESDTPDALAAFLARNPGLSCIVQRTDGSIVATLLCGHDGRRGYLHHLAVAATDRNQGIARALVETCLGRLRSIGIAKCNLFLFATNRTGRTFWLKNGWAAREDLVVIQKPLAG